MFKRTKHLLGVSMLINLFVHKQNIENNIIFVDEPCYETNLTSSNGKKCSGQSFLFQLGARRKLLTRSFVGGGCCRLLFQSRRLVISSPTFLTKPSCRASLRKEPYLIILIYHSYLSMVLTPSFITFSAIVEVTLQTITSLIATLPWGTVTCLKATLPS